MLQKNSPDGFKPVLDKIELKTLVHGDKILMSQFRLEKGALLPRHSHPHEQTGYLLSGRIQLSIGDETYQLEAGDSWCIGGGVEHNALALEDSLALEIFSPVRKDYLPED